ncbi:permease [Mesotoga sp. B105.6.4]|uniref:permease n=1 Tax=Mesotoga sp. B105.6.4 TaxID=1582224 RepID=UPI000CCC2DD3|nr:permease [Mesotoga sp. B105.6.4]PNS38758.1 permease [Mesotoga sp. B105.6.4]
MKAKRYVFPLVMAAVVSVVFAADNQLGRSALSITGSSFLEMLSVIPPILILLGLLDVWIPRERIIRHLGEESGIKGIVLSFILGAAAAGTLYGAFPIVAVFLKKGVKFSNVLIFIGAWSTTKIPMFMFEMGSLGIGFALLRLAINIPGILLMAVVLEGLTGKKDLKTIYAQATSLSE